MRNSFLFHTIFGDGRYDTLLKIVEDGQLLPSSKTGITRLCGDETSDFIYLSFGIDQYPRNSLIISPEVLRGRKFYINEGWIFRKSEDEIDEEPYFVKDGCSPMQLGRDVEKISRFLSRKVKRSGQTEWLSNQILIADGIDFHYVRRISLNLDEKNENVCSILKILIERNYSLSIFSLGDDRDYSPREAYDIVSRVKN